MRHAILLALLALPLPALAQAPAAGDSWTGAYAGGRAGFSLHGKTRGERLLFDTNQDSRFGDTVRTTTGADAFSPGFCAGAARGVTRGSGCRKDRNGLEWAINAGFDYDLGKVVVGGLAEFGAAYGEDYVSGFSTTPANYTLSREQKYTYGVRGRVGLPLGPGRNTMPYLTAGGFKAEIKNRIWSSNTANSYTVDNGKGPWGYRVGGGVEQRVDRHLSIGLLYLYSRIEGDNEARVRVGPGTAPATNPFRIVNPSGTDIRRSFRGSDRHSASVTANVRF